MKLPILIGAVAVALGGLLTSVAFAAETTKEGTCHGRTTMSGTQQLNMMGNSTDTGLLVFDEKGKGVGHCGEGPEETSSLHCFGSSEVIKGFDEPHGYCIETDKDGDQVVWRVIPRKFPLYSSTSTGFSEAIMGSGKYIGIVAKSKSSCVFDGTPTEYSYSCDTETEYKLP